MKLNLAKQDRFVTKLWTLSTRNSLKNLVWCFTWFFFFFFSNNQRWKFYTIIIAYYVIFFLNAYRYTLVTMVTKQCFWFVNHLNISNLKTKQPIDVILGTKVIGNKIHTIMPWMFWIGCHGSHEQTNHVTFNCYSNFKHKLEISTK